MSASDLLRDARVNVQEIVSALIGWILLAPIAALVPRRRDWIAVIGRERGTFVDNTKYFYIDAATDRTNRLRIVFITEHPETAKAILGEGYEAMVYPSLRSAWYLARCGSAVVDSIEWYQKWRRFLLIRARLVQLWHGVGFKRIELDKWRNEAAGKKFLSSKWVLWPRMLRRYLYGRAIRFDAVVGTSTFYRDNVFSLAFRSRFFPITGYPRNGFRRDHPLAWINVDPALHDIMKLHSVVGRKLVLVAPTYRHTPGNPFGLDSGRIASLDSFCEQNGIELIFKFHPYERAASTITGKHLHVIDPHSDIYPLLQDVSALVTDYSSVYMDFLLLDRPVFFLTPDLEQYLASDRSIQFDFESMTPGPKFRDWDQLLDSLLQPEPPVWRERRQELARLAFDNQPQADSSKRLLDFMQEQGWIGAPDARRKNVG